MKIQIDTITKTIAVEQDVVFAELFDALEKLIGAEWKQWKLKTNTTVYWSNPIEVRPIWQWIPPVYPTYPFITYAGGTNDTGVYQLNVTNN